jgi:hypothetical protein
MAPGPLVVLGRSADNLGVVEMERWYALWKRVRRRAALRQPDDRLALATFIVAGL